MLETLPTMPSKVASYVTMIDLHELFDALSDNQLIPYFQPIVEVRTGRLLGFEVLTRWQHPERGAYLPLNLIELAEQSGLISEVAEQVFAKAFRHCRELAEPVRLSVNVSPAQFGFADFAERMEAMAGKAGFALSRLTIEITESALLSDFTRSLEVANSLKELGCRLSLDDFGTGFSSLAHLHALPFHELKIDRTFIARMTEKRESRKIVAAILGLSHSLGLNTVAEGIETAEQADALLHLGCESGQGWFYGRPAPFDTARRFAEQHLLPVAVAEPHTERAETVSSLEAFPGQRLAQLQAIYDGAPVGLCFLDCSLRYVSINQRLAEMNGASVASHLGSTVEQMVPEVYPHIQQPLFRALSGEEISGVEVPHRRRDTGEPGWTLVSYQPAFDEAGEVIGISVSVLEITELKQAREELQRRALMLHRLSEVSCQTPQVPSLVLEDFLQGALPRA